MPPSGLPEGPHDLTGSALAALGRGATVVTATQRLARHLRHRHDTTEAAWGLTAWPAADVLPWDGWIQRLWLGAALVAETEYPILLGAGEERLLWRQVVAADTDRNPADAPLLAQLAAGAREICGAFGLDTDTLSAAADSADSAAFARWSRRFEARCRELERMDGWQAAAALARLPVPVLARLAGAEVCFAGFDGWPPGRAGLAAALERAGVRVGFAPEPEREVKALPHRGRRVRCDDEDRELALAAAFARERLTADPARTVGVVVPRLAERGAAVRRAFLDSLVPGWQLHPRPLRPLTVSLGRALSDYPVIHSARLVLRFLGGELDWEEASQLLRSRYLGSAGAEGAGRARAEWRLREQPYPVVTSAEFLNLCRQDAPLLAGALAEAWDWSMGEAGMAGRQRDWPGAWAARFSDVLRRVGWPGEDALDSEEYQATCAWTRMLETYSGWAALVGRQGLHAALGQVTDLAGSQVFEPEGQEGGVQVLGLLEAGGLQFDHLWVCGVTGDAWPPGPQPHPLLPLPLQRRAGLPEASPAGSLELARRRFAGLAAAAPDLVWSWPARRNDEELAMSPLLASLPASPPEQLVPTLPTRDRDPVAASGSLELNVPDPPPPLTGDAPVRGGARLLSLQSECPARAFLEFRLKARELPTPAGPLNGLMRGNVAHDVLAGLYRLPEAREGLGGLAPGALREFFEATAATVLGRHLLRRDGSTQRLKALETARLWRLVEALARQDAARGPFTVESETERDVALGPLALELRLDRLETHGEGSIVIDYKTGEAAATPWRRVRLGECQLPLYAVTASARGAAIYHLQLPEPELEGVVDGALVPDGGVPGHRRLVPPERFFRHQDLPWVAVLDRWQAQLENLAAEFAAGDFRVNPRQTRRQQGQFALVIRTPAGWASDAEGADDDVAHEATQYGGDS